MYISRQLGCRLVFKNGLSVGFSWMHGNGTTTKRVASLAAYHPPKSITWRWALRWIKPQRLWQMPKLHYYTPGNRKNTGHGHRSLTLPLIGTLSLEWQPYMWRKPSA